MSRSTKQLDTNRVVNVNLLGMKIGDSKDLFGFEIYKGWGDEKEILEKKAMSIKGNLKKVECGSYDYKDERGVARKNKTLTFYLDDGEYTMKYGTGYNMVSRQAIYTLASIEGEIGEIEMTPYVSKKGFKNIWIKNNGEDVRSKFDYNEDIMSKVDKYPTGNDYSRLDEWIETILVPEINNKLEQAEKDKLPF